MLAIVFIHGMAVRGNVSHWNAYVANPELSGQGNFYDAGLMNNEQCPVAAKAGFGNKRRDTDYITSKLAALQFINCVITE